MKTSIFFLSFAVLLTFVRSRTYYPMNTNEEELQDIKILLILDSDDREIYLNNEEPQIKRISVSEEEVSFHYKSRKTYSFELSVSSVDLIFSTDFDPTRRTMFIVHGWNNDKDATVNTVISEAMLAAEDWNIFVVDWSQKAKGLYTVALGSVPGVGDIVAKFIDLVIERTGLSLEKINLAGHSLGAHVVGHVGNIFNGEIETIIGMDPALPFVSSSNIDKRLDSTDAKYVQVIHTCGGFLGFNSPIGHADFYPNGGRHQSGCGIDAIGKCSHGRAYLYFAESILNDNFRAINCDSYSNWKNGLCDDNEVAYMGGNNLDNVCGKFYLNTNNKSPFAMN